MSQAKPRGELLFLCVANSARSQLAEGWARALAPPGVVVHSAGSAPGQLHPRAVEAMAEVGIDISRHYAKSLDEVPTGQIGTTVTLCAEEMCPVFPGDVTRLHWPTDDPAKGGPQERDAIEGFRRARDAIELKVRSLMKQLQGGDPPAWLDQLDIAALQRQLGEKWNTYEPDVLPAWVAQMDYPLAEPIRDVLRSAALGSDVGYPISPRETPVLELFAERMQRRFGWKVEPRSCEIVSDVVQGIYLSMMLLRGERDGVVVQTPIYPPFLSGVRETGSRLVENRMRSAAGGWELDLDGLRAAVDERTGMFLLCNPHNPTGRVLGRNELEAIAQVALEHDLVIGSDEIHSDLVYAGRAHIPIASLAPEVEARTVTLSSASKAFNIPGLRCAVAHFGSPALQKRLNQAAPRSSRGGIGILGLSATEAAWSHSDPWLDDVRGYLQANRDFLRSEVARRFSQVVFHPPEAAYLAWLDWSAYSLEPSPARYFHDRGRVALSEGRLFGEGFEDYARINFATSRAILSQVLDRIQTALDSLAD